MLTRDGTIAIGATLALALAGCGRPEANPAPGSAGSPLTDAPDAASSGAKPPGLLEVLALVGGGPKDIAAEQALASAGKGTPAASADDKLRADAVAAAADGDQEGVKSALAAMGSALARWDALGDVLVEYGRAGDLGAVDRAIADAGFFADWEPVLVRVAGAASDAGHAAEALDLARGLEDGWCRSAALIAVSDGAPEAERLAVLEEALSPARKCAVKQDRCETLMLEIAVAMAEAGDESAALGVARSIPGTATRDQALVEVGWAQIEAGHAAEAEKTAAAVSSAEERLNLLAGIARHQVKAGEIDDALRIAAKLKKMGKLDSCWDLQDMLCPIADAFVSAGDVDRATALGDLVKDEYCLPGFRKCLGESLARAGRHDEALEIAMSLRDEKEPLLASMAGIYARAGDLERASKMVDFLLSSPGPSESNYDEEGAIELAEAMVEHGDVDGAVAVAERFDVRSFRAMVLLHVAAACLETGHGMRSLDLIEKSMALFVSNYEMSELSARLAKGGHFEGALVFIFYIEDLDTFRLWRTSPGKGEAAGAFMSAYREHEKKTGGPPEVKVPELLQALVERAQGGR